MEDPKSQISGAVNATTELQGGGLCLVHSDPIVNGLGGFKDVQSVSRMLTRQRRPLDFREWWHCVCNSHLGPAWGCRDGDDPVATILARRAGPGS